MQDWQIGGAWVAFTLTYLALAIGYVPWFRLDRTGAAFVGAVLMVSLGVIDPHQAFLAQDYQTLALLFSMMLVVSFLVNVGLLDRFQRWLLGRVTSRRALLATVVGGAGLLSALFINDVICMAFTPVVLDAARRRGLNPIPFLLGTAMASNIGSLATPVGNPQNIYLASTGDIPYTRFVLTLGPVALLGLVWLMVCLEWGYRGRWEGEASAGPCHPGAPSPPMGERPELPPYVMVRTAAVLAGILVGFWVGLNLATVACAGAAVLLVTRRVPREKIFALVDWDLLVLFVSLFILMAGTRHAGIVAAIYGRLSCLQLDQVLPLSALTVILSNLCSNVPAVLFLTHMVKGGSILLLMAMVSTLGGNLTLIGSIANLIVAEKAKPHVRLDFATYLRMGVPVTLGTLALGLLYWRLVG